MPARVSELDRHAPTAVGVADDRAGAERELGDGDDFAHAISVACACAKNGNKKSHRIRV